MHYFIALLNKKNLINILTLVFVAWQSGKWQRLWILFPLYLSCACDKCITYWVFWSGGGWGQSKPQLRQFYCQTPEDLTESLSWLHGDKDSSEEEEEEELLDLLSKLELTFGIKHFELGEGRNIVFRAQLMGNRTEIKWFHFSCTQKKGILNNLLKTKVNFGCHLEQLVLAEGGGCIVEV